MNEREAHPESMHLILESEKGAVWFVPDGAHFWIRFGNVRWMMDEDAMAPYRDYLRNVGSFLSSQGADGQPAYLRTRDPAICLAFGDAELRELTYLLDAAQAIHSIERGQVGRPAAGGKAAP